MKKNTNEEKHSEGGILYLKLTFLKLNILG